MKQFQGSRGPSSIQGEKDDKNGFFKLPSVLHMTFNCCKTILKIFSIHMSNFSKKEIPRNMGIGKKRRKKMKNELGNVEQ